MYEKNGPVFYSKVFLVVGITAAAFVVSVLIQTVVRNVGLVSMIYILAAFLCAVFTDGYIYGVAASLMDMLIVNWAFTYPQFAFNFTISDNLFSALCMLTVCIITSMLTTKLKRQRSWRRKMKWNAPAPICCGPSLMICGPR